MQEIPSRTDYSEFYYDLDETTAYAVDVLNVVCDSFNIDTYAGKFPYHKLAWNYYNKRSYSNSKWWLIAEANDVVNPFEKQEKTKEYLIPISSKVIYQDW